MAQPRLTDEELLGKYAGAAIPPLVVDNDSRLGLVNGHLLEIYQRGFGGVHNIPLGVLLIRGNTANEADKWLTADYHYNEKTACEWTHFCRLVREYSADNKTKPGNANCEICDRQHATYAESAGKAVAYLCCHGMIDFAVPVHLGDKTIAILFSGQLRPQAESLWPNNLLHIDEEIPSDRNQLIDLSRHTKKRRLKLREYGIKDKAVRQAIRRDSAKNNCVVDPNTVTDILHALDTAAGHLSDLASKTYELEKQRVTSLIRFEFCRSLMVLKSDLSNKKQALSVLKNSLDLFAKFYGFTFVSLSHWISTDKLRILCQVGLDDSQWSNDAIYVVPSSLNNLNKTDFTQFDLNGFRHIPLMNSLWNKLRDAQIASPQGTSVRPKETPQYTLTYVRSKEPRMQHFDAVDINSISEISSIACLVCETLNLLFDLHESNRAMDKFIEDVSHDLRSPIQSIVTKVSLIKRSIIHPKEYTAEASKLGAAVMRISLVARRIWTLQLIQRGTYTYQDSLCPMRETIARVVDTLEDLSHQLGVILCPHWDSIESVPHLRVDVKMLFEAILNLVENAIKYSRSASPTKMPQVVINARHNESESVISIGNRGIKINSDEKDIIFNRYYRSKEARRFRPEGAGIGLSIVKTFMDHYHGDINVSSEMLSGSSDYLTIFELHFKK